MITYSCDFLEIGALLGMATARAEHTMLWTTKTNHIVWSQEVEGLS